MLFLHLQMPIQCHVCEPAQSTECAQIWSTLRVMLTKWGDQMLPHVFKSYYTHVSWYGRVLQIMYSSHILYIKRHNSQVLKANLSNTPPLETWALALPLANPSHTGTLLVGSWCTAGKFHTSKMGRASASLGLREQSSAGTLATRVSGKPCCHLDEIIDNVSGYDFVKHPPAHLEPAGCGSPSRRIDSWRRAMDIKPKLSVPMTV